MFRAQKQAKKQCSEQSIEAVFRARKKMVQLGTWGFGLGSQYMCVPSCRDNWKLGTCLVCLVNLKLGTLVPISSVQAVVVVLVGKFQWEVFCMIVELRERRKVTSQ